MEIHHSHKIEDAAQVRRFIFAGKATITLRNSATGNRFTYKFRTPKKQRNENKPVFFVDVMTGPDNDRSFNFAGTLFGNYAYQHSYNKSVLHDADTCVKVVVSFLAFLERGMLPRGVEVWHEGKCGRCGRKLTVPASILSGIGPECEKKRWKEADAQLKLTLTQ
jgi:hypothetical protein